jgi:hypothetical protein
MKTYRQTIEQTIASHLYTFEVTQYDGNVFIIAGEYFTLDLNPMVEGIQLHVHEKTDVIVECMMEELAEMTVIREKLEPLMNELIESFNKEL